MLSAQPVRAPAMRGDLKKGTITYVKAHRPPPGNGRHYLSAEFLESPAIRPRETGLPSASLGCKACKSRRRSSGTAAKKFVFSLAGCITILQPQPFGLNERR